MWKEIETFLAPFRSHTLFVACSGGVDSMALLHYLRSNGFKVHALHVNYHKRGAASDADQELVTNYCQKRDIPFNVRDFTASSKGNFQEQARQFRYAFFEEMANGEMDLIALGHQADDQIETFCMHLMRKSGVLGLASMPRQRKKYIRPFLHLSKKEVVDYARKNKIPWREDASNLETHYLRNKWRLDFLPIMEREDPGIRSSILKLIQAFQLTQQELEQKMTPIARLIQQEHTIPLELVKAFSSEENYELWRQLDQPSKLFHRFEDLLTYASGKHIEGYGDIKRIHMHNNHLVFEFKNAEKQPPTIQQTLVRKLPATFSKNEVYLDPTKLVGSLRIRPWQQGDRIASIGVTGSQLVSKIIKDANIPPHKRASIFVLQDDQQIVWVVGLKINRNTMADASKKEHLKVSI